MVLIVFDYFCLSVLISVQGAMVHYKQKYISAKAGEIHLLNTLVVLLQLSAECTKYVSYLFN